MYKAWGFWNTPPHSPRGGFRPHLSLEWRQTAPVASTCHGVVVCHARRPWARRGPAPIAGAGPEVLVGYRVLVGIGFTPGGLPPAPTRGG